jgi:hypothetical protein
MNVYFDDVRNPPNDDWVLVREPAKLKELLLCGVIQNLSMDHDLGDYGSIENSDEEVTGYTLLNWMEETENLPKGRIFVHSSNPVGRMRMMVVIQRLGKE